MPIFTRENTDIAVDLDGLGQQHRAEDGGMTIALERWHAGLDTTEMCADLPDGHAYYIRPGHNAHVDEDVDLVEFTRADQTPGIKELDQ